MNSKKSIDRNKAKEAIKNCDFEKLKKLEKEKGFVESIIKKGSDKKIPFFNLGANNNYKNLLDSKLLNKMNGLFQNELVKYKYE